MGNKYEEQTSKTKTAMPLMTETNKNRTVLNVITPNA